MRFAAGLALLLLTLTTPVRAETDLLFCRMSGTLMRACCCPTEAASPTAPTSMKSAGCCDAVHIDNGAPPSRLDDHASTAPAAGPVAAAVVVVSAALQSPSAVALPPGPNPRSTAGPPRVPVFLSVLHILG